MADADTLESSKHTVLPGNLKGIVREVKYDSAAIQKISPDKVKEKKVFSDQDLHYKKEEAEEVNWFARFIDWILEKFFGRTDVESRVTFFKVLEWIIVIAGVAVVIWLLMRSEFMQVLRGRPKETVFSFSDMDEDIKGIDFSARIASALRENNFRLAVRWYYLKQLNVLNTKGLIHWQTYKTNIDYYKELKSPDHKSGFKNISGIYDYVWYGQYEISSENFTQLEDQFKAFESLLNNVQR